MKKVFVVLAILSLVPWVLALARNELAIDVAEAQARAGLSFRLEIDGQTVGAFRSVSGLGSETEIVEYRDGDIIKKIPGRTKWSDITLKKGITANLDSVDQWRSDIESGREFKTKSGSVVIMDDTKEVARYNFYEGWPCKWKGMSAVGNGSVIAIEEIAISVERIERSRP